jgi:hypothetical protein
MHVHSLTCLPACAPALCVPGLRSSAWPAFFCVACVLLRGLRVCSVCLPGRVAEAQSIVDALGTDVVNGLNTLLASLTCSDVADVYYGIYFELLQPVSASVTSVAVVVTLIVAFSVILAFVSIPVDVRLGNDGIDLNNIQQTVIHSVQSSDVAIEMTDHTNPSSLPVAEPMGPPSRTNLYQPGSPRTGSPSPKARGEGNQY